MPARLIFMRQAEVAKQLSSGHHFAALSAQRLRICLELCGQMLDYLLPAHPLTSPLSAPQRTRFLMNGIVICFV